MKFESITSYIGSEITDPTDPNAQKPPRSAKHVVTLSWSWSPMHSRWSEYRLATDKEKKTWDLYEISYDDASRKKISARVASGKSSKQGDPQQAALLLLKCTWQAEVELWEFDPSEYEVDQSGLLEEEDILDLVQEIAWITRSNWLGTQSQQAIDALRLELPDAPNDQILDTLEEIESCIADLELPTDFFELAKHYRLKTPCLLSLACLVVEDATLTRSKKEIQAKINIEKFRDKIDILVSDLDDQNSHGGGMNIPSLRSRARSFLENYVAEHGELPSGVHVIHNFFKASLDFGKLRKQYSL